MERQDAKLAKNANARHWRRFARTSTKPLYVDVVVASVVDVDVDGDGDVNLVASRERDRTSLTLRRVQSTDKCQLWVPS